MKTDTKPNKHYSFDSKTQKYTFFTEKKFGKNLVFAREVIDKIIYNYSNINGGLTAEQIAVKIGGITAFITYILRVMKITHDTLPYTPETIQETSEDVLVEDVLSSKKFSIANKKEKENSRIQAEDTKK